MFVIQRSCSNCAPVDTNTSSRRATHFAPAGREPETRLREKAKLLNTQRLLVEVLDRVPQVIVILNPLRQAIFANRFLRQMLGDRDVLGQRPGELLSCWHCVEGPDGCGTGQACRTCGAVEAILRSQRSHQPITRECHLSISADPPSALELRVTAASLQVSGKPFTLLYAEDISPNKRLEALQRTFFHDLRNTCGAIEGYAQLLKDEEYYDEETVNRLVVLARKAIEIIQSHRDLLSAEQRKLACKWVAVSAKEILSAVKCEYEGHPVAKNRQLRISRCCQATFVSDQILLLRVLGNMVKNALEAENPGATITLGCDEDQDSITFFVHNPSVMPEQVRLQVFRRSFSTKGQPGRGIGTYSMKLLGETYLDGKVTFTSREPEGTTFRLQLPKIPVASVPP